MIITVVAYKANAIDTCRGCVMDRYDSDLQILTSDDVDAIAEFVADIRTKELNDYKSSNFTFFINGRVVDDGGQYVQQSISEDLDYDVLDEREAVIESIKTSADVKVEIAINERKAAKALKERKEAEARAKQQLDRELTELRRLQAKYLEN